MDYLNTALAKLAEQRGERKPSAFKLTATTKSAIGARLEEFDLKTCQRVVDYLVAKWGFDHEMQDYLRPSTIFRPNNFAEYAVMSESWENRGKPQMRDGKWVLADGTVVQGKSHQAPNPASRSTDWAKGRQIQIRNPQVAKKLRQAGLAQ
nr:conserved phage C-terminal domain-containing protein [Haemophilus haemolyticus]